MKKEIYSVMENVIGWNLYEDFDDVVQMDLNTMTEYWRKIQDCLENNKPIEFTLADYEDLNNAMGFCIDFIRAVAIIDNTEKLKKEEN